MDPSTSSVASASTSVPSYFPLPFHLQNTPSGTQKYPAPYYTVPSITPSVKVPTVPQTFTSPTMYSDSSATPSVSGVYALPQYHQAQQLFQRDAQTITPEALESVKAALASSEIAHKAQAKKRAIPRKAAGQSWEDPTLVDWPENDFRLFCGNLGNEVNDDILSKAFSRFPSFNMARVVRENRTGKTRGYGFVSFANPLDLAAAMKEMNGKYVGNRPIKLRKSNWKERTDVEALSRQKNHVRKKPKLSKKSVLHK
ncbi:RNA-binding protein [Zostera marina]|uniref:RNA-binding protein n=1 Tax=Zostera marina TaxID=29655 RepID=A0A0K9NRG1_ZOSMR|nr:RNA-binding protein [Zostera marina]